MCFLAVVKYWGLVFSHYSFSIHDFRFVRGGDIIDFIKSNILMLLYMLVDSFYQDKWWQGLIIFFLVAPIAFTLVMTIGLFAFNFGRYKTKREILNIFTKAV